MTAPQIENEETRIAVSTSAILDMSEADAVWRAEQNGEIPANSYFEYTKDKINEPFKPGPLYDSIHALSHKPNHKIILISRNSMITGIRALRTLLKAEFLLDKFSFTNGHSPVPYIPYYQPHKFLTTNEHDANRAQQLGIASAIFDHLNPAAQINFAIPEAELSEDMLAGSTLEPGLWQNFSTSSESRRKFSSIYDADGVLFDGSSEAIFQHSGLQAFRDHEHENVTLEMPKGPYWDEFVRETKYPSEYVTHLLTTRGAAAFVRIGETFVINGIEPTGESHGVNGLEKGPLLKLMRDRYGQEAIFYDDSKSKIENARAHGMTGAGRVPGGPD